ncbi:YraN family protein [Candidatus Parcubacteria bacterium]|nr:MAG: YraN family protein [Candidatus Parcubacteria bacterium]
MSKKYYQQNLGRYGEELAKKYYESLGYQVIRQNYRTRYGELDLVVQKGQEILVVEVKTRQGKKFGYGEEIVNQEKLNHIIQTYQILALELKLGTYYEIEICVIELDCSKKSIKRFLV